MSKPMSRNSQPIFAMHESPVGTKLSNRDVGSTVAIGGKPDIAQKARCGSD